MAELLQRERLQPLLLDRLTDEEPHNTQEGRDKRVLSMKRFREAVLRDLSWLFNVNHLSSVEELSAYPQVARSVLNYGMADMAGKTVGTLDAVQVERNLRQTIWDFEPRILRNTVKVRIVKDDAQMSINAVAFIIEGELWAQPVPLRLYLRTDLDLETGGINISEYTGRS